MAKSKYSTNVEPRLLEIAAWCRDGATDEEIYTALKISKDTFYRYKKVYSDFSDALKENKEIADIKVENALNRNALGYSYEEECVVMKKEILYNEQGKKQQEITYPVTVSVTKHKEAETKAQQFWLQNRKPDKWKNQMSIDGKLKVTKLEDIINGDNS